MPTNTKQSILAAAGINERSLFDFILVSRLARAIEGRIAPLEAQRESLDQAIDGVQRVGLSRINEVLGPAIEAVLRIQERGFLIARSTTSATLANGNILSLFVEDLDERALFTPSPFTALTREDNPNDYAIVRTIAYDPSNGEYLCEVLSFAGNEGPHNDWVIAALAGATVAQMSMLDEARDAADEATLSADAASDFAGSASEATGAAQIARGGAETARDQAQGFAGAASGFADEAAASAEAAATFDPANYYQKTETRTRAEITDEITAAVDALIGGAPGALDTLNELAAALADDAAFASTVTAALAGKQATSEKGVANGYAGLDDEGLVPTSQLPAVGIATEFQEFLTSGTWTKPAGIKWVYVELVGGGGSGAAGTSLGYSGGGGGAFVSGLFRASDLGASEPVVVGSGGAAKSTIFSNSQQGNDGGSSSFAGLVATGGYRGNDSDAPMGSLVDPITLGASGYAEGWGRRSAAGGGSVFNGGGGGGGTSIGYPGGVSLKSGNGGAGAFGSSPAEDGQFPGGGGGACDGDGISPAISGAGGNGVVRVWAW